MELHEKLINVTDTVEDKEVSIKVALVKAPRDLKHPEYVEIDQLKIKVEDLTGFDQVADKERTGYICITPESAALLHKTIGELLPGHLF